jgi:hypothetical protein
MPTETTMTAAQLTALAEQLKAGATPHATVDVFNLKEACERASRALSSVARGLSEGQSLSL